MSKINYWQKFEEDVVYHLYNRGINGTSIFAEKKNYFYFLDKWRILIQPFVDTLAYCLMPNHFHFLIRVKPLDDTLKNTIKEMETSKRIKLIKAEIEYNEFLEDQFKRLFSSYALAFNKQENRSGSLFQKRFKRVSVNEYKRCHLLAYIHHNPIHHRFKNTYEDWQFSSYTVYSSDQPSLIAKDEVLNWFHNDREKAEVAFEEFHRSFKKDRTLDYLEP